VRDADDTPHAPRGSAVPSAGKGRKRGEPDAGLEPQPQG
jgi:cell division protease FtsH